MSALISFHFTCLWPLLHWNRKMPMTNEKANLNICHEKMCNFVSFTMFGLTVVIKLRNIWFWKSLKYKKRHGVRFENAPQKMFDFVLFSLFRFFILVIKLTNFDFVIFFDKKNDVRSNYVFSNSVWSDLSFFVWV